MPLSPDDWSVVVIGYWNRAILTPAGIAKQLFGLENVPVKVLVTLDTVAPHMVEVEDVIVIALRDRLIVKPVENTIENLAKAIQIAKKALTELPRTPVSAAGFNLRYRSNTEPIKALDDLTASTWDERLADAAFQIDTRSINRVLLWKTGKIQVFVTQEPEGKYELLLNFEANSNESEKLQEWLSVSANEIDVQAQKIFRDTIGLTNEEITHV